MRIPCEKCIENDRCSRKGIDACEKLKAFIRYKEKCEEISEKTRRIMKEDKSGKL